MESKRSGSGSVRISFTREELAAMTKAANDRHDYGERTGLYFVGACRGRPRHRRAADQCDELAPSDHSIWGFNTQEEWDGAMKKLDDQHRDEFYMNVCAYVRGEPNNIGPGTIGQIEAQIAKKLVEKDPALLRPENKEKLLVEMRAIYDRDHAVCIQLDPEDVAFAQMLETHEDDLPQA